MPCFMSCNISLHLPVVWKTAKIEISSPLFAFGGYFFGSTEEGLEGDVATGNKVPLVTAINANQ